jgi:regulator of sirC expression with transglutaminase-like and TPR domain
VRDKRATPGRESERESRTRLAALIHLLGDEDPKIATTAWEHLENLGERSLPMVEQAARESPDPKVRSRARQFLKERSRRGVFEEWVGFSKGAIDLETGALLVARSEYPDAAPEQLRGFLAGCARVLERRIQTCRTIEAAAGRLVEHLHGELGFTGEAAVSQDPDGTYLNRVLERRVGTPVALATVYLLVARRVSLSLFGVGIPGHFLLKYGTASGERFLDPFHGGRQLSSKECSRFLEEQGVAFQEFHLRGVSDREILSRTLGNLLRLYHARGDQRRLNRITAMLRLLEGEV